MPKQVRKAAAIRMNLLDAFIDFIDSIYWEGYAKMTAETDPQKFAWEFNEFVASME